MQLKPLLKGKRTITSVNPGILMMLLPALVSLCIVLAVVIMQIRSVYEEVYHDYARSKAYTEAQERLEIECLDITVPEDLRDCFERVIEAAREPQRAEEDLYAQKQMAQWAELMVYATVGIGIMTIIGPNKGEIAAETLRFIRGYGNDTFAD